MKRSIIAVTVPSPGPTEDGTADDVCRADDVAETCDEDGSVTCDTKYVIAVETDTEFDTETDDDGNYDLGSIAIQSSTAPVFSYIK